MSTVETLPDEPPSSRHIRVPLPSACIFYSQKSVYARPFDLGDLNALTTAKNGSDLTAYITAIGRTISMPISQLTQDDFRALCYWHRVNSYPNKPLTFNWTCNNPQHVIKANTKITPDMTPEQIQDIEDAKKDLRNRKTVSATNPLEANLMDRERFDKLSAFLSNKARHSYPEVFLPPTVGDMIEFAEMSKLNLRNKDLSKLELSEENLEKVLDEIVDVTSDDLYVRIASNLNPATAGATLSDRIEYIKGKIQEDPDKYDTRFMDDLELFEELSGHGITEIIKVKCVHGGCRQQSDIPIDFDLFNFFPFV